MNRRIAEIRRYVGLSQEDFGARLDVTQNYVWMIESGKRVPSERLLKSICREFHINENWLRTGEGQMNAELERDALREIAQSRGLSDTQYALLLDIMNSPPEEIDAVISFMKRLSSYLEQNLSKETPPERNVHDWSREEQDSEYKRQADAEDEARKRESGKSSTSGPGLSDTDAG